jgi:gas vesicle protein
MNSQHSEKRFNAHSLLNFSAGFLMGSLIGAGAMLLLAPRTGKQTRSKIEKQGVKLRDQAVESMEEAVNSAGDKAQHFTEGVHKEADELQQYAHDMIGKVKN